MDPYIFLFSLGLVWLIFAVVQDMRSREIANWLTFSLLIVGLGFRSIYAIITGNSSFFIEGIAGVLLFMSFAYLLYYGRAFAGGDAKLLVGLGSIVPLNIHSFFVTGFGFVAALFLFGAVYSFVYTFFLIRNHGKAFVSAFNSIFAKVKAFQYAAIGAGILIFALAYPQGRWMALVPSLAIALLPILYTYLKAVEKSCMVRLVAAKDLREGDWLIKDIKLGSKIIKKTVHGLSAKEILLLKKAKKSVMIKEGVPFSPAFFFAYVAMLVYVLR